MSAIAKTWFGERVLVFKDPDGVDLSLVEAVHTSADHAWYGSELPNTQAIRGIDGVELEISTTTRASEILAILGFSKTGREGKTTRFETPSLVGNRIDVTLSDRASAIPGTGSVHHVAFRAHDDEHQRQVAEAVRALGLFVTDVKDRTYFRAIYFRDPSGILFEVATDAPGFAVDEPAEALGERLMLPAHLEAFKANIPDI